MRAHRFRHNADIAIRRRTQIVASIMVSLMLLAVVDRVLAYSRSGAGSPIGPATVPPSSFRSGLVDRPSGLESNGNLLITGNVAGGKHFHGPVPYRSTTSINTVLGSTHLDSFMRYTEPTDFGPSSQGYSSFYSPTGSVTTLQGGRDGVFTPVMPGTGIYTGTYGSAATELPYATGSAAAQAAGAAEAEAGALDFFTGARLRTGILPLAPETPDDTGRQRAGMDDDAPLPGLEGYERQWQELQRRLGRVEAGTDELERSLTFADDGRDEGASDYSFGQPQADDSLSRRQALLQETMRLLSATMDLPPEVLGSAALRPTPDAGVDSKERQAQETTSPPEAYTGPGLRLYDPQQDSRITLDAALSASTARAAAPAVPARANDYSSLPTPGATSTDIAAAVAERLRAIQGRDNRVVSAERADVVADDDAPSQPPTHEPAPRVISPQESEKHLQMGQSYLTEGKHLRAAESFVLASAYNPNEVRAYLGRCQALFAVGEFQGSGASLAQAIERDPEKALQKVDLVWTSGGPEAFIARFNGLAKHAEAGNDAQLHLLLAYVYYQMERPDEASTAIETARRGLPSSTAVEALSRIIKR